VHGKAHAQGQFHGLEVGWEAYSLKATKPQIMSFPWVWPFTCVLRLRRKSISWVASTMPKMQMKILNLPSINVTP
jgi:hypothetical protein